jgi:AmmeMemoRadiSam system protein B
MSNWLASDAATAPDGLCGIAAPHVSPAGGHPCYASAYRLLGPHLRDKTFVVLGTSHYGAPDKFGLTRKPYVTPYGPATTALDLVDRLEHAAPGAVLMEDYCHAVEHSIEFQVLFLQSVVGPDVKVLPILCGSFARSIYEGGMPEDNEDVRRFLDALGEMNAARKDLFWVLGVDMAHMGARYGDSESAKADEGMMEDVGAQDMLRISAISAGLRDNYWGRVQQGCDEIRWCGSAPFYSFLYAAPQARGTLERYSQWNIDEHSVVTFAGMSFHS